MAKSFNISNPDSVEVNFKISYLLFSWVIKSSSLGDGQRVISPSISSFPLVIFSEIAQFCLRNSNGQSEIIFIGYDRKFHDSQRGFSSKTLLVVTYHNP